MQHVPSVFARCNQGHGARCVSFLFRFLRNTKHQQELFCFRIVGVLAHIRPIFDTISVLSYELDEDQYSEHEACDPWVQHLLVELEEVCRPNCSFVPT